MTTLDPAKPASQGALHAAALSAWSVNDSASLYRINDWSGGYFSVNTKGNVCAQTASMPASRDSQTTGLDLHEIVTGLRERGITTPVLLRFKDILGQRLTAIRDAFQTAINENNYQGAYRAVYPIKVNQQHQVVEELSAFGTGLGFGLEVGSKPELLAVMAMSVPNPNQLIICNGFKDANYIEAVVLASKLGRQIIPVVENLQELRLIIRFAKQYNVRPRVGVRVKLAASGMGRWASSGGFKSKFGLFTSEVLEAVELLKQHDMLDCLQLLHCHSGSQVQDIGTIKRIVTELAHVYVELTKLGAGLTHLDIGGGLGVDYTGSQSNDAGSMNYSLEEFASDVVYRIANVCNSAGVNHPAIVTECGRAMVAYSSVLVFDVTGSTGPRRLPAPPADITAIATAKGEDRPPQPLLDLKEALDSIEPNRLSECYHDAVQARDAALTLFSLGYLSLPQRALTERLFWTALSRIHEVAQAMDAAPDFFADLADMLSDVYFCNVSIFQSLPDAWAIDQLFPVMPIHRLGEKPTRRAVLADITCDSDGSLDSFPGEAGPERAMSVHELTDEPYYLGVFLVGAYQETLGDLHNLFGDAHAVHISTDTDVDAPDGSWAIEEVVKGDTAAEVLGYVQYEPERMHNQLSRDCERAVRKGALSVKESQVLLKFYEQSLRGYTYLEADDEPGVPHAPGA